MVIIEPLPNFDDYIKSLSESARKNYAYIKKHNSDLVYQEVQFDEKLCERFMQLWERQLIRGQYRQWAFPVSHVRAIADEGRLKVFGAYLNGNPVSLHFIERHGNVWECHPPMYEKSQNNLRRYLAKYMWFNLIKYIGENRLGMLDLGGGPDLWKQHIRERAKYPNPQYKWLYVPEEIKENPEKAKNWTLKIINNKRYYEII